MWNASAAPYADWAPTWCRRRRAAARATRTSTGTARTARRGRRRSRRASCRGAMSIRISPPTACPSAVLWRALRPFIGGVARRAAAAAVAAAAAAVAAAAAAHLHGTRAAAATVCSSRALRAGGRADEARRRRGRQVRPRALCRVSLRSDARLPDRRAAAVEPRNLLHAKSRRSAQLGLLAAADGQLVALGTNALVAPCTRPGAAAPLACAGYLLRRATAAAGYCAPYRWRRRRRASGDPALKFALG